MMRIKNIAALALSGILLGLLSSCAPAPNLVASMEGEKLTAEELLKEEQFYRLISCKKEVASSPEEAEDVIDGEGSSSTGNEDRTSSQSGESTRKSALQIQQEEKKRREEEKENRTRRRKLVQQWAVDKLVEKDGEWGKQEEGLLYEKKHKEAVNRFGGEEALESQLKSYHISKSRYEDSLKKEARGEAHRKAYLSAHPLSSEACLAFFKKDPEKCYRIDYVRVSLPTKAEAEEVEKILRDQPNRAEELAHQYNNDLFERTGVVLVRNQGWDSPELENKDLLKREAGNTQIEFVQGSYQVTRILKRKESAEELGDHIRKLAEDEAYLSYLNKLGKKYGLMILDNNLPIH